MAAEVTLEVLLEMERAEKSANKFQEVLVENFKQSVAQSEELFNKFANKTEEELRDLAKEAERFAKNRAITEENNAKKAAAVVERETNRMKQFYADAANTAIGAVGNFKDAYEKLAGVLTGISDASVKAGSDILDTTQKAAAMGAVFGPIGAAIGGTTGFVISLRNSMHDLNDEIVKSKVLGEGWTGVYGKGGAEILDYLGKWGIVSDGVVQGYTAITGETALTKKETDDLTDTLKKNAQAWLDKTLKEKSDANQLEVLRGYEAKWDADQKKRHAEAKQRAKEAEAIRLKELEDMVKLQKIERAMNDARNKEMVGKLGKGKTSGLIGTGADDMEAFSESLRHTGDSLGYMTEEQIKAASAQLEFETAMQRQAALFQGLSDGIKEIGSLSASMIGGVATDAFGDLFEALAANEDQLESFGKAFARRTAESLRATGSELIGDGIKNILMGGATAIATGGVKGLDQAAMGGVEVATGAAMGGVGIGIGRRVGKATEAAASSSAGGNGLGRSTNQGNQGPVVQAPSIINIQSLLPNDKRSWEQLGHSINKAQNAAR